MRTSKTIIQLAFGVIIILWLFQMADATQILITIQKSEPLYILGAAFMFILASVTVALALHVALKKLNVQISMKDTILASFAGQLLSDLSPARTGYFLTPLILKESNKIPLEPSMAAVFTTGIINAFIKAAVSIGALTYFIQKIPLDPTVLNTMLSSIILLTLGGIALSIMMWVKKFNKIIQKLCRMPLLGKTIKKIFDIITKTQHEGKKLKKALLPAMLFIILSIVLNATALNLISKSFGQNSPTILDFILICPLASALAYIPLTPAGLGVQETAYVLILQALNVHLEIALAFALITRALFTGTDIFGLPKILSVGLKHYRKAPTAKLLVES